MGGRANFLIPLLSSVLLLLCILPSLNPHHSVEAAGVLGIDYGAEWFKVALLKPGQGNKYDVVLNSESKRKTKSLVVVKGRERLFGTEAINMAVRLPHDSYPSVKTLLGRPYEDPVAVEYRDTFDNTMVADPFRNTVAFEHNEVDADGNPVTVQYAVEEIVAMQLKHARDQVEVSAGELVKDCVITVPRFFNQYERQALLDAAELAGLNVLGLMHDDVAVAINFALNRPDLATDDKPAYHIFYDSGASSTVAALISFQKPPVNSKGKSSSSTSSATQEIVVEAVGFDRTLGGHAFDLRLQKHLADAFDKKHGGTGKVFKNHRAMMKLLREAQKVKEVLSANTETFASIENLMDDLDFRLKVTRTELETITGDLLDRAVRPIQEVLQDAKLELSDIGSVILHGGCTRVPAIQAALKSLVGEDKVAKNVNSDEAAVMGAVIHGATLSRSFLVRNKMRIRDIASYPIDAVYNSEPREDGTSKTFRVKLYGKNGTLHSQKLMNFKRSTNFEWSLEYGFKDEQDATVIGPQKILTLTTRNLTESIEAVHANETLVISGDPKVKALVHLSDSGILEVKSMSLFIDVEVSKEKKTFADRVLSFFGKKDDNSTEEDSGEGLNAPTTEEGANADNSTTTSANATAAAAKPELKTISLPLNFTVNSLGVPAMSADVKLLSLKRFEALDAEDFRRRQREEARNGLEAYVYSSRDLLEREDILEVTTEAERTSLQEKLASTSDWMYEEGDDAPYSVLKEQLHGLERLRKPLEFKRDEKRDRPSAVTALRLAVGSAHKWAETAKLMVAAARTRWEEDQKKKDQVTVETSTATTAEARGNDSTTDADSGEDIDGGAETTASTPAAKATTSSAPTIDVFRPIYTDDEIADVLGIASAAESWLAQREKEQSKLPGHAKPAFTVREATDKAVDLDALVLKLSKRKRPPIPKPRPPPATKPTSSQTAKTPEGKSARTTKAANKDKDTRDREEL
ncbi:actin-like ATPase domain-containing protein [Gonapodya prolifera JEL478]|uniref:Actin-like ATPase domain-containing protein n=1 Tax=Gonapodya prolifera (strain JEL478) TaxID=1344416 RepID=A0A139A2T3_GONPJ|nr:actin-like ATPase domain-containing protein [Gonapodya prolifera JEL478]|eukprot:KXS11061.1 actin-like ATPase domain-containing protein [Gonapodya prolifera JEL478]